MINPLIKPNVPVDPVMMDNTFSTMVISTPENGICNSIGEKNAPIRGSRGIRGEKEAQISESDPSKDRFLLDEESEPVEEVVKSHAPRTWWWPEKPVWPSKLSSPPLEDDIRINPPALEFDLDDNGFADDGFAGKGLL